MISKYNSTCRYCKLPTKAGVDQYDIDSKSGYHWKCEEEAENQPPSREQLELAGQLGYRQYGWEDLQLKKLADNRVACGTSTFVVPALTGNRNRGLRHQWLTAE